MDAEKAAELRKKRTFRKFTFRGIDLDKLLDYSNQDLMELFCARQRRKFCRGIKRKPIALLKKLRKAKRETSYGEKPEAVKTHLRNMVIVPEMIGSVVGVYNGKQYISVEVKPEMCSPQRNGLQLPMALLSERRETFCVFVLQYLGEGQRDQTQGPSKLLNNIISGEDTWSSCSRLCSLQFDQNRLWSVSAMQVFVILVGPPEMLCHS